MVEDGVAGSCPTNLWPTPAALVDVLLNHALARVPRDSSVRIVIWRA
jgi:hypothetical protein